MCHVQVCKYMYVNMYICMYTYVHLFEKMRIRARMCPNVMCECVHEDVSVRARVYVLCICVLCV